MLRFSYFIKYCYYSRSRDIKRVLPLKLDSNCSLNWTEVKLLPTLRKPMPQPRKIPIIFPLHSCPPHLQRPLQFLILRILQPFSPLVLQERYRVTDPLNADTMPATAATISRPDIGSGSRDNLRLARRTQ
jgi:hypothetical protein